MRRLAVFLLLASLVGLAWTDEESRAKIPITGEADPKFARFDELLTTFLDKYNYPGGVSLAVGKDGQQLYTRGYGYADRETKQPVKTDSLFRLSSLSKPITAVAILQLVEKGRLNLDDRILTVLGLVPPTRGFDERWRKITIRHLLEHRAGWDPKKSDDPMFLSPVIVKELGGTHPAMPATIIRYMLRQPLDFEPGSKFVYCNFGYCLLGRVIEKVSRQTYEAYVKKNIIAPLGLKSMRQGRTLYSLRAPNEVRYHSSRRVPAVLGASLGRQIPAPYGGFCIEAMDSHAGWLATASDILRFLHAFEDPEKCPLLKPKTIERMFARPEGEDPKSESYYALGWSVQPFPGGKRAFWHDGSLEGSSSMIMHRPDEISFAILLNSSETIDKKPPIAVLTVPMQLACNYVFLMPPKK
ncbi:MAG: serine hydrolase domain-containing protein [Gemmataceae bacterium]